MKKFFQELSRRNVFRAGAAYLIASWLITQVVANVGPILELPAWFGKGVLLLLAIGFPVAIVLSWMFELTPGGFKRTEAAIAGEGAAPRSRGKIDYLILGGLALVLVVIIVDRVMPERPAVSSPTSADASGERHNGEALDEAPPAENTQRSDSAPAAKVKSVAVLPFVALSSGEDDGYFADGLTEEIINALTTVSDLLVTARTSAFHFKGKDTPIPEIAATLGVAHVVEGSVRRNGDKVRITAQLIRASDGFHLWSQTYDRPASDEFAVQTEIAENIARALGVLLDDTQRAMMQDVGVRDVEAFEAFQRGLSLFSMAHGDADQIQTLMRANVEFEEAIRRKPDFAQAYLQHSDLYSHIVMDEIAGVPQAVSAAGLTAEEAAQRLAADLDAAFRHETDNDHRAVIHALRTFLSDDWTGLGRQLDAAFASWTNCRSGLWIRPLGLAFGRSEDVLRRTLERTQCSPIDTYWADAADAATMLDRPDEALAILDRGEGIVGRRRYFDAARARALIALGRFAEARRAAPEGDGARRIAIQSFAADGDAAAAKAFLATTDGADYGERQDALTVAAVLGERAEANRIAGEVDAAPLGVAVLVRTVGRCMCGAPFDLLATPNFARQLKEGDLPWPPPSPIEWPLKDW